MAQVEAMVAKMRGEKPKPPPELPESMVYLWSAFVHIKNASRSIIQMRDILDYQELSGISLNTFEHQAIIELDAKYIEVTQ